jgi:hypothetical protein
MHKKRIRGSRNPRLEMAGRESRAPPTRRAAPQDHRAFRPPGRLHKKRPLRPDKKPPGVDRLTASTRIREQGVLDAASFVIVAADGRYHRYEHWRVIPGRFAPSSGMQELVDIVETELCGD